MSLFGKHRLSEFPLEPQTRYLNHGTVGVIPKAVLQAQQQIRDAIEAQPARYLLRELCEVGGHTPLPYRHLRQAANQVAAFLGAKGQDLVFVDNATAGCNAVLQSLELNPGDEILITSLIYGAIAKAAEFVAHKQGAKVVGLELPFPPQNPQTYVDLIAAALTPRTRLLIIDHITSETALILPLEAIVQACHAKGVLVLVDGAHAPGAIKLNLEAIGADYYTANLHKWAFAPRSCAFLWTAPQHQATLHPTVISWGLGMGYTAEFDWVGTRDPSAYLAAPHALAYIESIGAEAMRHHNHQLAWQAKEFLTQRWGLECATPEEMVGCMVSLPLPKRLGSGKEAALRLSAWLVYERGLEAPILPIGDGLWVRISAQIYNDFSDIEALAEAIETYPG